jgi:hypothetical protein
MKFWPLSLVQGEVTVRRSLLAALLLFIAPAAAAAEETLFVGNARLTLGMSRDVSSRLLTSYTVQCLGNAHGELMKCKDWMVSTGDPSTPRFEPLASLYLSQNDKLRLIMKYYNAQLWANHPEKFASILHEVLRQYGERGERFVASVAETRQPGSIAKTVFFTKGRRTMLSMLRLTAGSHRPPSSQHNLYATP